MILITPKVNYNLLPQTLMTFDKVIIICSLMNEEAERAMYESVYHLYKDKLTLYSGEYKVMANVISTKLYQDDPSAKVFYQPLYIILTNVNHRHIMRALKVFDKVFIICSPRNEHQERKAFEHLYRSLSPEVRDKVTLYSGDHKLMVAHIKEVMKPTQVMM